MERRVKAPADLLGGWCILGYVVMIIQRSKVYNRRE